MTGLPNPRSFISVLWKPRYRLFLLIRNSERFLLAGLRDVCMSLSYTILILDLRDSSLSLSLYIGVFFPLWFKIVVVRARQPPGVFFYLSHQTHFVILINERQFSSKCFPQSSAGSETISPKIYGGCEVNKAHNCSILCKRSRSVLETWRPPKPCS